MAEMQRLSKDKVSFVIQNGEGSLKDAQTIAESFHAHQKISAIFAIGTSALQAAARVEKTKPIFMAAVSDPEALGIMHPSTNICGTTDQVNTDAQTELILRMIPRLQTVALIYNPSENNSQGMIKKMQASLEKRGIKHLAMGALSVQDLSHVVRAACAKADAILVPNDNLVASHIVIVAKEAALRNTPLFVSDIALVKHGALAAQGAEYRGMGQATAVIGHRVLFLGVSPEQAGIVHPEHLKTVINQEVAMRLQLPKEVLDDL